MNDLSHPLSQAVQLLIPKQRHVVCLGISANTFIWLVRNSFVSACDWSFVIFYSPPVCFHFLSVCFVSFVRFIVKLFSPWCHVLFYFLSAVIVQVLFTLTCEYKRLSVGHSMRCVVIAVPVFLLLSLSTLSFVFPVFLWIYFQSISVVTPVSGLWTFTCVFKFKYTPQIHLLHLSVHFWALYPCFPCQHYGWL